MQLFCQQLTMSLDMTEQSGSLAVVRCGTGVWALGWMLKGLYLHGTWCYPEQKVHPGFTWLAVWES